MARGFNLTSAINTPGDSGGGDLDINTLAVDSDTIIRDAWVTALRTRKGSWYFNPRTGLDPESANVSPNDNDIAATIEADVWDMLQETEGATVTSVLVERVGQTRDWRITILGRTTRLLTVVEVVTLA